MTSKITIVIPNYNGMKYIDDCIRSILAGTRIPEIIVVDNASSDGSREWVRDHFKEVKLICLECNTGFAHAVNEGICAAKTPYVFLLNDDTVIDKRCVEVLEQAMEEHQSCFSVGAKMINMKFPDKIDSAGDFYSALGWAFARGKDKAVEGFEKSGRIFSACAGAAVYRRKLLEKTGLFDEAHFAYLEDIDLGYRANIMGYKNWYIPQALVYHAGSGTSGSRYNEFKIDLSARNSIYLILKNMPLLQIILNLPFLIVGFWVKTLFFAKKGYGRVYVKGLGKGFSLFFSEEGKRNKVSFRMKYLGNYIWIQWQLWINMLRRLL